MGAVCPRNKVIELCSCNEVEPHPTSKKTRSAQSQHDRYDSFEGNVKNVLYDEFIEAIIHSSMSSYSQPSDEGTHTTKPTKTTKTRHKTRANTVTTITGQKAQKPDISVVHSPSDSLNNIADDIYKDIQRTVKADSLRLEPLRGWLSHKQSSSKILSKYVKRWVVVQDGYMLWSDRQMTVRKGVSAQEKKRWNKCVPLTKIKAVSLVFAGSDAQFKFKLALKNREYIWRAGSLQMKHRWVDGLKQRMAHANLASVCSE